MDSYAINEEVAVIHLMTSSSAEQNAGHIPIAKSTYDVEIDTDNDGFDGPEDQSNPLNWPAKVKWTIVAFSSIMTTIATFATIMCTPAAPQIMRSFKENNQLYVVILVSIWEAGEAIGPLFISPLSELYGRRPVYHAANIMFVIFSVACALSVDMGMLIAFRLLNGLVVASVVLGPSIIGDMFVQEQRGGAMALTVFGPILGPLAAPIIGGYLTEAIGWRWNFWVIAIMTGAFELCFLVILKETYQPQILKKRARGAEKTPGDMSAASLFQESMIRPLTMLFASPVIAVLSIYMALVYGYLYIVLTTMTEVFEDRYGFSRGGSGLAFLGLGVGGLVAVIVCGMASDLLVKRKAKDGEMKPEHRLPLMFVGALVMPVGLFLYGWTTQEHVHWIVPIIATGFIAFGLLVTLIIAETYLVDAFPIHSASAMAGGTVLRALAGALLPLVGPPLYASIGLGWGNSILGFVSLIFMPVPLLLMKYGERQRKNSILNRTS